MRHIFLRNRAGTRLSSAMSTLAMSSPRPVSATSSQSGGGSSGGSICGAGVKWDREGLQVGQELRRKERKEREVREKEETEAGEVKSKGKKLKEGKVGKEKEGSGQRSVEGQRRTLLSEVFLANHVGRGGDWGLPLPPIVTIELAMCDGHSVGEDGRSVLSQEPMAMGTDEDERLATPVKRARPHLMSEQLLGCGRPKCYEGDDGKVSSLIPTDSGC